MKLYRAGVCAGMLAGALAMAACSSSGGKATTSNTPTSTGSSSMTSSATTSTTTATTACSTGTLKAEGSTAQTNAMSSWVTGYQKACTGATINYNATGSGAGVTNFNAGQDDFAGSDSALDPTKGEVAKAASRCGSPAVDLPMVVGPIAVAYNLKGVDKLILDGPTTAKIFLGQVKTWNDKAITALNPGVTLPSTAISVFYRSDSSGTTQNFEKYLAATAPKVFTTKPDKDSSKAGFAGQGKAKSQGVASAIAATAGGIGYTEYSFAVSGGLNTAWINNGGGAVQLSPTTASTAAEAATLAPNGTGDLTLKLDYATTAAGAYPIVLVTYEIACTHYKSATTGTFVKNFLTYTATTGQAGLKQLGYAPLPASLQSKVEASVASIS